MRIGLLAMVMFGGVVGAAAGCGGPQDAGSPGPAQTPNAGRDPGAMDPADAVSDPGATDGSTPSAPETMGTDPGRSPSMTSGVGGGAR